VSGTLLTVVVLLPALGALLTVRTGGRSRAVLGTSSAFATLLASVALTVQVWERGGRVFHLDAVGDLEVVLVMDGLAAAMLLMVTVTGSFVAAFALLEDLRDVTKRARGHWPLSLALWAALQVLFLGGDLLTLYLMFEAVGVAAVALVAAGADRRTTLAAARYLYAELVATITLLFGIALTWQQAGTLVLAELPEGFGTEPLGAAALALMTAGLLVKVPLVPVHLWLPAAHALAASAVSPVLSALVVKTAFVVLLRAWHLGTPHAVPAEAAQLLGALGVVAILWGSMVALRATEVKVLIAYSTIAQLGVLFLAPPLLVAGQVDAWTGGLLHAIAHAPAKAAALLAAAVLVEDAGHGGIEGIRGAAARRPVAVFALGVAAVSLVGLPPTVGFVAKWHLLFAGVAAGQWWWVAALVVGSMLTAGYLMRLVKPTFDRGAAAFHAPDPRDGREVLARGARAAHTGRDTAGGGSSARAGRDELGGARRLGDGRDVVALTLALVTVLAGIRPAELLRLLQLVPSHLVGG